MRSPLSVMTLSILCLCMLTACDKKETPKEDPVPPPAEAAPSTGDAPDKQDTPPKNAVDPAASKAASQKRVEKSLAEVKDIKKGTQLRQTFLTHLKAGRKLVQKKDYKGGLVELEKARKLDPNDARILSEIGFAAMLSDDLVTARKANIDSVRFAKEDKLKAASLYNLGRIAEKEAQPELAAGYYRESILLRPNKTVEERLAALGAKPGTTATGHEPCSFDVHEGKSKDEVCKALATSQSMDNPVCYKPNPFGASDTLASKVFDAASAGFDKVELIHFYDENDDMTEIFHLGVLDKKGTWHTVPLYWVYNPGAFGIMEDIVQPIVTFEDLKGDGSTQIVVRVGHHRHDSNMGVAEIESEDTTGLIVIGQSAEGSPELLANFTTSYRYLLEKLDFGDEEEPFDSNHGSKELPIEEKFNVKATFDKKGSIVLAQPAGKDSIKAGIYPLGASELRVCSFSNGF